MTRRQLGAVAATAAATLLGGGAAAAGAPELAFVSGGNVAISVHDGTGARQLTGAGNAGRPVWSPDGSRIAYLTSSGTSVFEGRLWVAGVDAIPTRELMGDPALPVVGWPAWSPGGGEIAATRRSSSGVDLWLAAADGSSVARLTNDPEEEVDVGWRSTTEVVYATRLPAAIWAVSTAGGARRALVRDALAPALSPDRSRLAFVRATGNQGTPTLHVAAGDGLFARAIPLADWSVAGPLAWSPDGSRIAAVARRYGPSGGRFGPPVYPQLWVVDVESGSWRRVTGHPDDFTLAARYLHSPVWWPWGDRLLYGVDERSTEVVGADGACEQPFSVGGAPVREAAWRPGSAPAVAPLRCVDLWLRAASTRVEVARREQIQLTLRATNTGNLTAPRVVLAFPRWLNGRMVSADASHGTCSWAGTGAPRCDLGTLPPGEEARVTLRIATASLGPMA